MLNRFSYVNNRPINFNDPTGHRPCDDEFDCARRPFNNRIDYKNNTCNQECRRSALSKQQKFLFNMIEEGKIDDREAFARLTEYGAGLAGSCVNCFVNDIGAIFTGHSGQDEYSAAFREVLIQLETDGVAYDPYYQKIVDAEGEFHQSGYDAIFQDPAYETDGVGGNQPHHYWFYLQVSFESGYITSVGGNLLHETYVANDERGMSYNDYALGVEGAKIGTALYYGFISPNAVGDYIRSSLAPGSAASMLWTQEMVYPR